MATTKVEIANSALIHLGGELITAITEDNKRAKLCNEQYTKVKRDLLETHPWNFGTKRVSIARLASTPLFEFTYEFQLPSDCLRVIRINDDVAKRYVVEGSKLLTDEDEVWIEYIADISEGDFTYSFAELFALKLASSICYSLTQSASYQQYIDAKYEKKLSELRSRDAQEGTPRQYNPNEFALARRGGHNMTTDVEGT